MDGERRHGAWTVLLGVVLIRGAAGGGVNMTAALFLPPVAEELGVGLGGLSLYFSILSVVLVLWLPLAGRLLNRYDVRAMAAAGAALQTLSFAGFGSLHSVYGWYLLAVPYAMGSAILLNLLGPILINRWFARNTGLMLGLQMAAAGLSGAALQPLASRLIARSGWRAAYRLLGGGAFFTVTALALLLLRNRPQDRGLQPWGKPAAEGGEEREDPGIDQETALHSASFYLLLLFMAALTGVGAFTQHIPAYGGLLGHSLERTGTALALASAGTAAGAIAIGAVCDRVGVLRTSYGLLGAGMLAVGGFLLGGSSFPLFGLATFLHGLTSSAVMVLSPILTLAFYGQRDYERIYAKVSMGAPLASILLIPAYGFVYDWTHDYFYVLLCLLALLALAALCITLGWRRRCTGRPGGRG